MDVIILGAGIVGLTTAYELTRRGHHVSILEREAAPGRVSSYQNGGQFSYTYAEPLASPAMLRQLPKLVLGRDPGLSLHPAALPELIPWGFRFLRECSRAKYLRNIQAILELASLSRRELQTFVASNPLEFDFRATGKLHLYAHKEKLQQALSLLEIKSAMGFQQVACTREQCLAAEPALSFYQGKLAGGVYSPLDQSGDAYKLVEGLKVACLDTGRCDLRLLTEIVGFECRSGRVSGIRTATELLAADAYVLCAGTGSAALLEQLGIRLPVVPVKGYSITVPALTNAPRINLTDTVHKVVFTKIGDRLRVAGLMEFSGLNYQPEQKKTDQLLRLASELMPKAGEYDAVDARWAGLRPMTPDGRPIIGPSRLGKLWLNIGHGMLGNTLAFGSARLLVERLEGLESPIEPSLFHPKRFP